MIPIVTGERRKAKAEQQDDRRKYRKKDTTANRLCTDDIMTRAKLKEYQNAYAESMQGYGLKRGIDGSEAKHITITQYYRDLLNQSESVQENLNSLLQQQEQAEEKLSRIKREIKTGELKSEAVNMATKIVKRIGSFLDNKEMIQKEQEIENLKGENSLLKGEISDLNKRILKMEQEHKEETDRLNKVLDKIDGLFPIVKEWLRIEELCRLLGFGKDMLKELIQKKPVNFSGPLYSPEFKRHFNTERSTAQVERHPEERRKLRLMIDGVEEFDWFKNKRKELLQMIGIKPKQAPTKGHWNRKGIGF